MNSSLSCVDVKKFVERRKRIEHGLFKKAKTKDYTFEAKKVVVVTQWKVHVNALGVPFCRTAVWEALATEKDRQYCRGFRGEVRQEYAGGKKYNPQNAISTPLRARKGVRLFPCK